MFRAETAERALKVEWSNSTDLLNDLDESASKNDVNQLASALNILSEDNLSMIEMRYFEKVKLKEIAVIMNLSESNAKVKMHRTLNMLRKHLKEK